MRGKRRDGCARWRAAPARKSGGGMIEPLPRQRQHLVGVGQRARRRPQFGAARLLTAPPAGERPARQQIDVEQSSARTGTAISAAAVGVGARRSAAKSISVTSVSWPTAEISGIMLAAAARTTISSLNDHRSSSEPPPRATMMRSGRGGAPPAFERVEARDGGGDLGGRAFALHLHRPEQHVARESGRRAGAGCRG